ncbi:MAG: COX15/CtaA family protein [Planctomycetes bacterium]|nr:COX15/CtaA family protein [Planctomycetota bacterium]
MAGPGLHRFACLTAAATFVLLVAGGQVTTTESGDAVPDWWFLPISYGSLLPRMVGGIFWEHGHRLVASTVGVLTVVLAAWAWRADPRPVVRGLALATTLAVVLQGCLGGLRVLLVAPGGAIAIVHACFAQVFFCLTVVLALVTSRRWSVPDLAPSPLPWVAGLTTAAVLAQVALGAVLRHTGAAPITLSAHVAGAVAVLALVAWCKVLVLRRHRGSAPLRRASWALSGVLAAQLALGLGSWLLTTSGFERSIYAPGLHMAVITGHQSVGALLLASALVLAVLASLGRPAGIDLPLATAEVRA